MPAHKPNDRKTILSREQGAVIKDWGGRLPVALVYPNSYYLGMSNLGIHAIYHLLNSYSDVVCERVFHEKNNSPPLGLESGRPLTDYTVIAFSVTYELDYFNVVSILRASGIPILAKERDESHPLVIAGGACITANPVPLSPFFDCLCIGEAEAILPAMLPVLSEGIRSSRKDLLKDLAALPGVYLPGAHNEQQVVRQWVTNLDEFPVESVIHTPDTELGNLHMIEVERGCAWGCNFCLVSKAFHPARFRSVDGLLAQAESGLQSRKRIGLVGPAVTDHPGIEELVSRIQEMGAELSVSSLRIKPLSDTVLAAVARNTKTVALAPEAGSQRLRRIIGKGFSEDDILEAVSKTAAHRFQQLKLYFMIGLPTETDDDIGEAIKLTLKCRDVINRQSRSGRITLTVSSFIPKAGTPFQWSGMAPPVTLEQRLSRLKQGLEPLGIRVKADSLAWSEVQAVLARGDLKVSEVLSTIRTVSLSQWRQAVRETGLDTSFYAHEQWDTASKLPWAMVDSDSGP